MTMARGIIGLLAFALTSIAVAAPDGPANPGFEDAKPGASPPGWMSTVPGYEATTAGENPAAGTQCVRLTKVDPGAAGTGVLMQGFDAEPYRGKRITLAAQVRYEGPGRVQMWMRVDREGQRMGFFDNMSDRPITARQWREYTITGNVDQDARRINIGLLMIGGGTAWLDDCSVTIIGAAVEVNEPPRALTERGLRNLIAFARLYGLARYFHPSDQSADADWTAILMSAVEFVEEAESDEELVARLNRAFAPIASTMKLGAGEPAAKDENAAPAAQDESGDYIAWRHVGLGFKESAAGQIYSSRRLQASWISERDATMQLPPAGATVTVDLVPGVWCIMPLTLPVQDGATVGAADPALEAMPERDLPEGWTGSGNDRTTRLVDVMIAWNVFQHFYPYFDAVETDWPTALRTALVKAAEDADDIAFRETLDGLVADLHDGHGNVVYARDNSRAPMPLAIVVLPTNEVVVVDSAFPPGEGPARGEVIVAIDNTPIDQAVADHASRISAATDQFLRWRLGRSLAMQPPGEVAIQVRRPEGARHTYRVQHPSPHASGMTELRHEPRPDEKVAEIEPGLWYVDLGRITDQDFRDALPRLQEAGGLVFDLRGYPSSISPIVISHLIDEPVRSAQWHVPVLTYPDFEQVRWNESFWPVQPQAPRLTSNVAFITDGRAISYAETYLGIVEHFEIADIVGEATAGTNGNVNPFTLPGGYSIIWTGMRVLKHDGSTHHGVGILPTVPIRRTIRGIAAGRDELLERAVELVSGRMERKPRP